MSKKRRLLKQARFVSISRFLLVSRFAERNALCLLLVSSLVSPRFPFPAYREKGGTNMLGKGVLPPGKYPKFCV
jgi:hypothetical protein